MTAGICLFQKRLKHIMDRRYKLSLFLTIIKLSQHLLSTNQDQTELLKIANEYKFLIDTPITKITYDRILTLLENLRKKHGGYYSLLFFNYKSVRLIDTRKMWEQFLHTCFLVTKYTPCSNSDFLIPQFVPNNDVLFDDTLSALIHLRWRGHKLEGKFINDPLHILSYSPLTFGNCSKISSTLHNINYQQVTWFRGDIYPHFIFSNKKGNTVLFSSYTILFNLYNSFLNKSITSIATDFSSCSLYHKYFLIFMFSTGDDKKIFVSMLLYTIVCKESEIQANLLFSKLPFNTKQILTERLNLTEEKLSSIREEFDDKSYEIKICALNAHDNIKKKAIEKLREIQSKPLDITKPQLFLDKLLDIPFGVFRVENQFRILKDFLIKTQHFVEEIQTIPAIIYPSTWIQFNQFFNVKNEIAILNSINPGDFTYMLKAVKKALKIKAFKYIDDFGEKINIKLTSKNKKRVFEFQQFVSQSVQLVQDTVSNTIRMLLDKKHNSNAFKYTNFLDEWELVQNTIKNTQLHVHDTLNTALYGQHTAKRAIEQIVCEWITGDMNGYCFGFQGPPGVGKTTLAKYGLSKCLVDDNNTTRPFTLIPLGGSTHGSVLEGHGYTYASSTCGKIVNTLIQSHCMNPIIFFDELDKVSKTPQGQEITNILVHLTDTSQNHEFYDKYFDGIQIDLSKVLFIFSYNDISQIDPILLDRIHTIRFNSFCTKDKINICKDYILPDIYKTLGILSSVVIINDTLLEYIIESYTREAGVRKIKQILSTMLREINIRILNGEQEIPITITTQYANDDLLKDLYQIKPRRILDTPRKGTVAGLFAITSGGGGIIHIEIKQSHGTGIEMTGNLGNIMKESVKVSYTTIYNIINTDTVADLFNFENTSLHIHAAEGAVPKDGPSAGIAISLAILSCLLDIPVHNDIAFTGEIGLNGDITAVGGIPDKLRGAFIAGIKTVFCPFENKEDVEKIDVIQNQWLNDIQVLYVKHITDEILTQMAFTNDISKFLHPKIPKRSRAGSI
tara:strand:- start:509 stop:3553 length:3045 start_codon:yes stop_codon:yes gene_type:complete